MKIRMTQTAPGSVDGIRVKTYEAGIEYDLSASDGERELAAVFVAAGMAEIAGEAGQQMRESAPATELPLADTRDEGAEVAPVRAKPGRKPRNN